MTKNWDSLEGNYNFQDHLFFAVDLGLGMKTILVLSANPEGIVALD